MKLRKADISIADIWGMEGKTWADAAAGQRCASTTIAHNARKLGFRKGHGGIYRYLQGPCIVCQEVHERDDIGDDYTCDDCRLEGQRGRLPYHADRWGQVPRTPDDWLELERIAHRVRMRDDARKRRLRSQYTRLSDGTIPGTPQAFLAP